MPIVAETERLILRTWGSADREEYAPNCNQPRVMRMLGGVQSLAELEADVDWFIECQERFGHTLWVVERKGDGAFLGFVGLDKLVVASREVPPHLADEVEVGWRLRSDAWGRGYAMEAAYVCLDIAFRVRRLPRVISRIRPDNAASIRLASKLGLMRQAALESGEDLRSFKLIE